MQSTSKTPVEVVREMAGGFSLSQMLFTAVKLRIADHLADGPMQSNDLARTVEADPRVPLSVSSHAGRRERASSKTRRGALGSPLSASCSALTIQNQCANGSSI